MSKNLEELIFLQVGNIWLSKILRRGNISTPPKCKVISSLDFRLVVMYLISNNLNGLASHTRQCLQMDTVSILTSTLIPKKNKKVLPSRLFSNSVNRP